MKGLAGVILKPAKFLRLRNFATYEILQVVKFSHLHSFNSTTKALPSATPAK